MWWATAPWVLLALTTAAATAAANDAASPDEYAVYQDALRFVDECGARALSLCLKERALKYLEALPNNIDFGGLKIKQIDGNEARSAKHRNDINLPDEPHAREEAVDNLLWDRLTRYLRSHTVELKVPPDAIQEMEKSVEEGRGKGGGGGGKGGGGGGMRMKGMMMLFQLKAAMLGAIALKIIGLVAFKALLVAKIALTIASIIALKKLLEHKHHTSTYEVVAHPHHEEYGHYDRSFSQEMAYRGHDPASRNAYGGYSYNN